LICWQHELLSRTLLDELAAKAAASPRARAHYNIHATPADLVQRFVVVASGDSYFRPHRHATRSELAVIVRGGWMCSPSTGTAA